MVIENYGKNKKYYIFKIKNYIFKIKNYIFKINFKFLNKYLKLIFFKKNNFLKKC